MDAAKYLREWARMCAEYALCKGCPIGHGTCREMEAQEPEKIVAIVEEWAKEHPVETRQSRFLAERWNSRMEAKEKGKEKAKPAWMPIVGQDGEAVGTFAFCPHCGVILSQFDIDGKKIGETSCRNCGTEITWEGYPQAPGTDTRKREKPDDI